MPVGPNGRLSPLVLRRALPAVFEPIASSRVSARDDPSLLKGIHNSSASPPALSTTLVRYPVKGGLRLVDPSAVIVTDTDAWFIMLVSPLQHALGMVAYA